MGSPVQIIIILVLYALFVKKWGPRIMQNRQPFELKMILIIYNTIQILMNGYMSYEATFLLLNHRKWNGRCIMIDESDPKNEKHTYWLCYLFCMVKILDLLDTVFFVLRKRYNQVSFLHFYHHIIVCMGACVAFRYVVNGHLAIQGYVNAQVHTVMYFYYLLSSISPNVKDSIWWKKYITIMQMAQFVILSIFVSYPWINGENCGYPFKLLEVDILQNFVFLYMFTKFYIKTYIKKSKSPDKIKH